MGGLAGAPRASRSPPRRSRWRLIAGIVIVVVIAAAVGLGLSRCVGGAARQGGGRPTITVGVAKAALGDVPIRISALGTVTPEATASVNARVSGMLVQVPFKEGQMVRKGQLLAQIDPRPFQVLVDQARGQLLRDQALLANARVDLDRYRKLLAQDSIASQQVDTQAALVKQDEAVVVSDRGALGAAQLNLSFTRVPAPVAGRVGLRQVDPGNQVTANQATPIAVVTEVDPIDVVFAVPEDDIPSIMRQAGSGGGLPVTAYDRAGGTALAQGKLLTIDNVVDTTTGTVKGKARFANGATALFPNQFVNVDLLVDTLKNQIMVPTTAVRHGPQGDFVYVLQPDGATVKVRPVTVGPGTGETVSLTAGLKVGETVITEGGDRLRDGAHVTLPGARRPKGGAGGGGPGGGHHRRGGGGGSGGGGGGAGGGSGGG